MTTAAAPAAAPAASPAPAPAASAPAPAPASSDPPVGFWNDGWRERLAGEDTKELKRLGRFDSPEAVYKSWRALEQKVSSNAYIPKLGENPTEAEIAEYRKAAGVPDDPGGYGIEANDDAIMQSFLDVAHKTNTPPEFVKTAMGWYEGLQQKLEADQTEMDSTTKAAAEDSLRVEWGGEYRGNMNAIVNHLNGMFGDQAAAGFLSARLPDGTRLGDNADILKGLARAALQLNPRDTLVPSGMTDDKVKSRLEEISHIRRTEPDKYWKSETMQSEYRRLLESQMKKAG